MIVEKKITYDFDVCEELKFEIYELTQEESQVIVHFKVSSNDFEDAVRIWKTTYLIDVHSGVKYPLLFSEGVALAPQWTVIPQGKSVRFTLFFKGLPKKCTLFHLVEEIPEAGGFEFHNIKRNTSDIYKIEM